MTEKISKHPSVERAKPKAKIAGKIALRAATKAAKTSIRTYEAGKQKARELDDKYQLSMSAHERKRIADDVKQQQEYEAWEKEYHKPENVTARDREWEEKKERDRASFKLRMNEIEEKSVFDLQDYSRVRKKTEPWTTVNIGPGARPLGINRSFKDMSKYIAFEPGWNPEYASKDRVKEVFNDLSASRPDENIEVRDVDWSFKKYGYDFPDSSADEVLISNVFDDFTIYAPKDQNSKIISEAYRMLKPGGVFLIQDRGSNFLEELDHTLQREGFNIVYADPRFDYLAIDQGYKGASESFIQ